jgi:pseudouridine synthase
MRPTPSNDPLRAAAPPPATAQERLQKFIARCGRSSRRAAEDLIRAGRVRVNGAIVRRLGSCVDPDRDRVELDGRSIRPTAPMYVLVHKPRGVVSTLRDPEGRPTLRDLLPRGVRLYPVGRLDLTASGLVLLTNDGALAERLMHPRHGVRKTYHVKVAGRPDAAALGRLQRGVRLDRRPVVVEGARIIKTLPTKSWLEITVAEGRHHLVRRLCEAIGHPAEKLCRVRLGPLALGALRPGEVRPLTPREIGALHGDLGAEAAPKPARRRRAPGSSSRTVRRQRSSRTRP